MTKPDHISVPITRGPQYDWRSPRRVTHMQRARWAWSGFWLRVFPHRGCGTCRFAGKQIIRGNYHDDHKSVCKRYPPYLDASDMHKVKWRFPEQQGWCGEWKRQPIFGRNPDA